MKRSNTTVISQLPLGAGFVDIFIGQLHNLHTMQCNSLMEIIFQSFLSLSGRT